MRRRSAGSACRGRGDDGRLGYSRLQSFLDGIGNDAHRPIKYRTNHHADLPRSSRAAHFQHMSYEWLWMTVSPLESVASP
jgi:hypothetical protein